MVAFMIEFRPSGLGSIVSINQKKPKNCGGLPAEENKTD